METNYFHDLALFLYNLEKMKPSKDEFDAIKPKVYSYMLLACSSQGCCIKLCPKLSALCKAAVMNDGRALEHIDHQTEELCILAVKQNPGALRFVKKLTNRIYDEALNSATTFVRISLEKTYGSLVIAK